jgi:hypothetical protein
MPLQGLVDALHYLRHGTMNQVGDGPAPYQHTGRGGPPHTVSNIQPGPGLGCAVGLEPTTASAPPAGGQWQPGAGSEHAFYSMDSTYAPPAGLVGRRGWWERSTEATEATTLSQPGTRRAVLRGSPCARPASACAAARQAARQRLQTSSSRTGDRGSGSPRPGKVASLEPHQLASSVHHDTAGVRSLPQRLRYRDIHPIHSFITFNDVHGASTTHWDGERQQRPSAPAPTCIASNPSSRSSASPRALPARSCGGSGHDALRWV